MSSAVRAYEVLPPAMQMRARSAKQVSGPGPHVLPVVLASAHVRECVSVIRTLPVPAAIDGRHLYCDSASEFLAGSVIQAKSAKPAS